MDEERSTEVTPQHGAVSAPPRPVWDPATGTWRLEDELSGEAAGPRPSPAPRSPALRAALAGGLVGAVVAAAVAAAVARSTAPRGGVAVERVAAPSVRAAGPDTSRIVEIAARAKPWVVNLDVSGRQRGIFGSQVVQGTGSGVILRSDGHIITNAHVVEGASQVVVTFASGEKAPARIVGTDPITDVAVVKVDRTGLPAAVIGSASDLKVGELAVAIGSPLGLRHTVTAGIISALGRTVDREGLPPLVDMIQTDAAVTQGNSGGALLDANGALVGINTAIAASPSVGAEGVAFAIPIDIARAVAEELIATGRATHPWLGIQGGTLDEETARQFGVTGVTEGAYVAQVVPGGPAARAGLKEGDVIVAFDGQRITSMDELMVAIRKHKVGDRVRLEVVRGGQRQSIEVTLGDRPENL